MLRCGSDEEEGPSNKEEDDDGDDANQKTGARKVILPPKYRLNRNMKYLRLVLMKLASLLAADPFVRDKFHQDQDTGFVMAIIRYKGKEDAYVCQYALWILTQFATLPAFQEQVASYQGMKLFLDCMVDFWPTNTNLLVRALIALYACLRLNTMLCRHHAEEVADVVVEVMKRQPDHAKLNLWGCWVMQELVGCMKGLRYLARPEVVMQVQAVVTRFYDDEVVRQAATQVLEVLVREVGEWKESLRFGRARGALS